MINFVWIVYGACQKVWLVACYPDREMAEIHCEQANNWLLENAIIDGAGRYAYREPTNPFDQSHEHAADAVFPAVILAAKAQAQIHVVINVYKIAAAPAVRHPDEYQEEVMNGKEYYGVIYGIKKRSGTFLAQRP